MMGFQYLENLKTIIPPKGLSHVQWSVACDVENPLLGSNGATHIYGPQKGANPVTIDRLEAGLHYFSKLIFEKYNRDITLLKGGGAAGGTAAGMFGFFNATLASGFSFQVIFAIFVSKIQVFCKT